ncbi:MAG: RluA family pseudouridine synthase [Clostridiales bacterium]|nr:RluA family pseudouridine synthase [Clostridiales bacterium]
MDGELIISNGVKILYEDNHLIVAVKPAGVLSQSDGSDAPDMLTILKAYIKDKYSKPGEVYLGLVHRLDRPVSGVMVFARTSKAASRLSEQIRTRRVEKLYRAVVQGRLEGTGSLENYILKDTSANKVTVFDREVPGAKHAVLEYRSVRASDDWSLIEIRLGTGRAHQIRAQFANAGHPLLGDRRYGNTVLWDGDICLQSFKLAFDHPTKGERMTFEIPSPECEPWVSVAP